MTGIHWLTCLLIAVSPRPDSTFRAEHARNAGESPVEEDNAKPWQDERALLPVGPSIRLNKLFALEQRDAQRSSIVVFSPDTKFLAVALRGGDVDSRKSGLALWNVYQRKLLHVLSHPEMHITAVAFVPPGNRLVSGCMSLNKVFLWDVQTGKLLDTLEAAGSATFGVTGLAAFPDGKRTIACLTTGLTVWDLQTDTHKTLPLDDYLPLLPGENPTTNRWCYAIGVSADGSRFATTALGGVYAARILLWNAKNCQVTGVIPLHRLGFPFAYSADGRLVAAEHSEVGMKGPPRVSLWDATSRKKLLSGVIFSSLSQLAFTESGRYLFAAGKHKPEGPATDNVVIGAWDVRTGKLVNRVTTDLTAGVRFALSPDNNLLAVTGGKHIDIYAIREGSGQDLNSE